MSRPSSDGRKNKSLKLAETQVLVSEFLRFVLFSTFFPAPRESKFLGFFLIGKWREDGGVRGAKFLIISLLGNGSTTIGLHSHSWKLFSFTSFGYPRDLNLHKFLLGLQWDRLSTFGVYLSHAHRLEFFLVRGNPSAMMGPSAGGCSGYKHNGNEVGSDMCVCVFVGGCLLFCNLIQQPENEIHNTLWGENTKFS